MEIVYDEIQTCLKQNIGLVPGAKNMSHILYVEDDLSLTIRASFVGCYILCLSMCAVCETKLKTLLTCPRF